MSDTVNEFVDSLITTIQNAEVPESVTNGMIAHVLDFLNNGYKDFGRRIGVIENNFVPGTRKEFDELERWRETEVAPFMEIVTARLDALGADCFDVGVIELFAGREGEPIGDQRLAGAFDFIEEHGGTARITGAVEVMGYGVGAQLPIVGVRCQYETGVGFIRFYCSDIDPSAGSDDGLLARGFCFTVYREKSGEMRYDSGSVLLKKVGGSSTGGGTGGVDLETLSDAELMAIAAEVWNE